MSRYFFLLILVVAIFLGCKRQPVIGDNSKVVVQPGRGIADICEVGMTLKQMQKATRDVTTHGVRDREWFWKRWNVSRHSLIQSLGAIAPIETDGKIETICFHVVKFDSEVTMKGLSITNPFRGKISDKLSFDRGPINRGEVESQFGRVDHVVTNLWDGVPIAIRGEPFLFQASDGSARIYYRHKGIDFEIESNIVTSFWIYAVRKPEAARGESGSSDL